MTAPTPTLSVAEAAAATGRAAATVRQLCGRGNIPGAVRVLNTRRQAMEWRIPAAWAESPANYNWGPGRRRGSRNNSLYKVNPKPLDNATPVVYHRGR